MFVGMCMRGQCLHVCTGPLFLCLSVGKAAHCPALSLSTSEAGGQQAPAAGPQVYVSTLNFYFWEFVFKDLCLHSEGSYQLSHPPSTKRVFCIIFCMETLTLNSLIVAVNFKSVAPRGAGHC